LQDRVPEGWLVVKSANSIAAIPTADTKESEEVDKQKDASEVENRDEDEIELLPQGLYGRNVSNSSSSAADIRAQRKTKGTDNHPRASSSSSNLERLQRNSTI